MGASWKSHDWDRLVRGERCPVCDVFQTTGHEDAHGIVVANLRLSRLFLARNQYVPGYCVLMCQRHVIEPYDLTADERTLFFDDVARVGHVLQTAFQADKMNYNILGNVIPHLHVHIIPRYFTDSAPNRPIDPTPVGQEVFLSAEGYADRIALIRAHLEAA